MFGIAQSVHPVVDGSLTADNYTVEVHEVASKGSEEMLKLKEKALKKIESKRGTVNITEQVKEINQIDQVVRLYSSSCLNVIEKSMRGVLIVGEDIYYDKENKMLLVIARGNKNKVFLYIELENNIYEVALYDED